MSAELEYNQLEKVRLSSRHDGISKFMGAERLITVDMQSTYTEIYSYTGRTDITAEQAFDGEYTLPDFCPDIRKILNYALVPYVQNVSQNGSSVTVDGIAKISIIYQSGDKNEIRAYRIVGSFSKTVELKSDNCIITDCTADCEYVNCRAINERKIDIHGAINIHILPFIKTTVSALSTAEAPDLQARTKSVDFCRLSGCAEKLIIFNDEIALDETNCSILNIICEDAYLKNEEFKAIADKVVYKAELVVKFTYLNENGGYETVCRSFPINQIIEVAGMTEDAACICKSRVCGLELKPYTDRNGDCLSAVLNVKIRAAVQAWKQETADIITDVYSTVCELDTESQKDYIHNVFDSICFSENLYHCCDISDGVQEIIGIYYDEPAFKATVSDEGVRVCGKVCATVLYVNSQSECCCTRAEIECDTVKPLTCNCTAAKVCASIDSQTFTLNSSESLELRCECNIELKPSSSFSECFYTSVSRDESRIKQSDGRSAMTLYFAKTGESVWDIAMKFNSRADDIMRQNELTNDILTAPEMLIIPSMA